MNVYSSNFTKKALHTAVFAIIGFTAISPGMAKTTTTTGKKTVPAIATAKVKKSSAQSVTNLAQTNQNAENQLASTTTNSAPTLPATVSVPSTSSSATSAGITDQIVAIVNDTPILQSQLSAAILQASSQLKSQNLPIPPAEKFYPQVLDQLIMQQVQLDMIGRSGLKADETQVNAALMNVAKQNGFSSLSEFQQSIDSKQAGSYRALRQQISEGLTLRTLQQQQIARRVKISDQDVDLFLKSPESNILKQSAYRTLHVRVPFNSTQTPPTEKQKQQALVVANNIAAALKSTDINTNATVKRVIEQAQSGFAPQIEGGDMGFHGANELPTDVAKDILTLQVGEVSRPILTPQGINVIKLVDKQGDEKKIIDQWSVRHILVSPSATLSPELAKQRIDSIYEQLRKGADFATLASTYSEDPGSASKGGSLGWVSEGDMVPEFEKMMKNTAVNDFSIPFQSQFGWHILKVEGKRAQDVTEEYRRNQARELLYQRQAPQALEDWLQEIRAQAYIKILDNN